MSSHQLKKAPKTSENPFLQIDPITIFQAAKISMIILSPEGIILFANDVAKSMLNNNTELTGKLFNKYLHGKSRINIKVWYSNARKGNNPTNLFLVPLKHEKSNVSWVNVQLSLIKSKNKRELILCQISECADNKEIEETKEQHDHFLSELINNIPDSIFIKDVESKFILVNQSIANRLGFKSPDDFIGKSDFDIHPKKLAQKYYKDEQEIIRTGQARLNIVEQVIDSQNNIAWHSTSKLPLKDREGKIIGIMGIGRDITQWVKGQKNLRKSKLAAEKADQLKTAFLSNFTHEIRTPLNGILGFSQYLKQTLRPEHKGHKYIDFILRNGKRLLHLISDIIDLSRIESGEISLLKKSFPLNDIMKQLNQSTLQLLTSFKKEKIKIELNMELKDDNSYIYSDDSRIKQVLYNLLSNAVKFTNKGKITFGYSIEKTHLNFYVKDTGIGIDSKDLKVIFESFTQVDNSHTRQFEGAGLGLTIAQGLVKKLDSKLNVISEPGKGSEFNFSIPLEKPPANAP
jgi:PAS domain S-box-containing protein